MTGVRNKCNRRVLSYSGLQRTPVSRVCQEICSITPHCLPLPTSVLYYLVLLNYGLLGIGTINNHFLAPPVLHRLSNKCVGWIWRYDKLWSQCMYVCAKSSIDHIFEDFAHYNILPKSLATQALINLGRFGQLSAPKIRKVTPKLAQISSLS